MNDVIERAAADRELKARHRAMWASGDYSAVAAELMPALGPVLAEACALRPGQRVLDVAAGTGNATVPAARAGADVVAVDLTPELFEAGRRFADRSGVRVDWREGDAEALPFADNEFDAVLSCVGVMFAPHHQLAADELVRVCRPGGTIGLVNWTPQGFVGQMFATMKPFAPAPPPGVQPPPLWGDPDHVRGLLGDRVRDVRAELRNLRVDRFAEPAELRDFYKQNYGPTIAVYRSLAGEPDAHARLDQALVDLIRRFDHGSTATVIDLEYLLLTARVRD
jgi:SAM-dependent methyltransferase